MELAFVVIPRESAHLSTGPREWTLREKRSADDRGALFAPRMLLRGICFSILSLFLFTGALLTANQAFAGDKPVSWKPIQQALLRVDDQPVKNWNVYQESKKGDPLLLQMGNRFLLIQVHERKIFELAPAKIERKGAELLWDPAGRPAEPLATSDWIIRDVGFAYRIGARLAAENRVLDLQLPHPMDLRYL
jgi:hypothetical protein